MGNAIRVGYHSFTGLCHVITLVAVCIAIFGQESYTLKLLACCFPMIFTYLMGIDAPLGQRRFFHSFLAYYLLIVDTLSGYQALLAVLANAAIGWSIAVFMAVFPVRATASIIIETRGQRAVAGTARLLHVLGKAFVAVTDAHAYRVKSNTSGFDNDDLEEGNYGNGDGDGEGVDGSQSKNTRRSRSSQSSSSSSPSSMWAVEKHLEAAKRYEAWEHKYAEWVRAKDESERTKSEEKWLKEYEVKHRIIGQYNNNGAPNVRDEGYRTGPRDNKAIIPPSKNPTVHVKQSDDTSKVAAAIYVPKEDDWMERFRSKKREGEGDDDDDHDHADDDAPTQTDVGRGEARQRRMSEDDGFKGARGLSMGSKRNVSRSREPSPTLSRSGIQLKRTASSRGGGGGGGSNSAEGKTGREKRRVWLSPDGDELEDEEVREAAYDIDFDTHATRWRPPLPRPSISTSIANVKVSASHTVHTTAVTGATTDVRLTGATTKNGSTLSNSPSASLQPPGPPASSSSALLSIPALRPGGDGYKSLPLRRNSKSYEALKNVFQSFRDENATKQKLHPSIDQTTQEKGGQITMSYTQTAHTICVSGSGGTNGDQVQAQEQGQDQPPTNKKLRRNDRSYESLVQRTIGRSQGNKMRSSDSYENLGEAVLKMKGLIAKSRHGGTQVNSNIDTDAQRASTSETLLGAEGSQLRRRTPFISSDSMPYPQLQSMTVGARDDTNANVLHPTALPKRRKTPPPPPPPPPPPFDLFSLTDTSVTIFDVSMHYASTLFFSNSCHPLCVYFPCLDNDAIRPSLFLFIYHHVCFCPMFLPNLSYS